MKVVDTCVPVTYNYGPCESCLRHSFTWSGYVIYLAMLQTRALVCYRTFLRAYSTLPSPHALIFLEHRAGAIEPASLSALTAAEQLGGKVTGLVVGGPEEVRGIVDKAKK